MAMIGTALTLVLAEQARVRERAAAAMPAGRSRRP